jgi:bifunctional DNase/RNase
VTTIRIAHAEPRPGRLANGGFHTRGHLVVLADDAGHRAVPIWIQGAGDLANLLERPAGQVITDSVPQELTTRLLGAAGARVTGVDIDVTEAGAAELSPEVTVARIGLAGPTGTRQVTADLALGLALAAAAGAPVRLADAVLDRLAVPVPDGDLLTPFLDRVPPAAWPRPGHAPPRWPLATLTDGRRPRYEPRNLDFAGGLDRWDLDSWPGPGPDRPGAADGEPDYAAAAEGPAAVLSSTVPRPAGSAALVQAVYADDYRGTAVTFSGEISADLPTGQAGLRLEVLRHWRRGAGAREDHGLTIAGRRRDWTGHEITARIPADADLIRFGIALAGPGRIALRNPGLRIAGPDAGTP